jgi:hypothetical protein
MWVATQDLPRTTHPFYARLNQILDNADFDGYVESLCQRFYADQIAGLVWHVPTFDVARRLACASRESPAGLV